MGRPRAPVPSLACASGTALGGAAARLSGKVHGKCGSVRMRLVPAPRGAQTLALELQRALTIEDPKFDDDVLKLMEAGAAHFIQDDEYC